MNKALRISIPILTVIFISVVVTTIMMNNKEPGIDPNLNQETTNDEPREKEAKMDKIYLNINNKKLTVNLENNSTTAALISLLPLNISMSDLNGNEKYAYLDSPLPTNVYSPKHIETGDVMLFGNNCLVIFYKSFDTNYDYSKIGHIDNLPELGDGKILVKINAE